MNKPTLLFRLQNYNIVSLGALLGATPKQVLDQFNIVFWRSTDDLPADLSGRVLYLHSFMQMHQPQIFAEIAKLKASFANMQFLAGGAQTSTQPDTVLSGGFDYAFCGMAEADFGNLLELWRQERLSPGIHRQAAEIIDLDSYPGFSPLIDYLPPIEISRGCNFGCMYCAVPGLCRGKVLNRSIAAIIGILEEYYRLKNRRKRIKFLSSNAFGYMAGGRKPDPAALQSLLKSVKDFGVAEIQFGTFPGEVRPDFVNREVMEIVSRYTANKLIVMGVQTGSNAMLQKMNRGHSLEQAIDAIALLHEFGYLPLIDLIIGNPGETYRERLDLLEFIQDMIKHYRIRVHLHAFMPLPGTAWQHRFQEPIEPDIHKRLKKLASAGHLEGWWENQIGIGRQHRLQAKQFFGLQN